ncbi:MAG: class I SAM-dependent methyltransferase [Cyanomargarita calcarea GSE-NOS-MK-12-04C]|uniref:Class I SAM-dependent methyltransferase n=1 Tax=Cyanomargarita calcarea GSE-NOS-MK-12-04C TaxID=2839659 RepID=A0A951UVH5_9CYAN|nr:class I SAM-dependent methyltransferase [Cyanomargarita calcarea GSE-NOS-MK-12-04C]
MSNLKSIRIPKPTRYQNAAIEFYIGLTGGSPYLHYGYWEEQPKSDDELTISKFRVAQEAYAAHLLSFIPAATKTILDVGCGIGGNAQYLLARGFIVEGLAPDTFQQEKFIKNTNNKALFHLTRFEDFQRSHSYDLVLFSESSQYIATDDLARGSARLLESGGYLLLCDMLRTNAEYKEGMFSNCHVVSELHAALTQAGFNLVKTEDISKQIAPSLDLYLYNFRTFGLTTIKYIGDLLAIAVPPLHALLSRLLGRTFKKLVTEGLEARSIFDRHLCYQTQLWQLGVCEIVE